jgi:hypothetical protein
MFFWSRIRRLAEGFPLSMSPGQESAFISVHQRLKKLFLRKEPILKIRKSLPTNNKCQKTKSRIAKSKPRSISWCVLASTESALFGQSNQVKVSPAALGKKVIFLKRARAL